MKTRERIELSAIDDNPWQPRGNIEPEALEELAASIHQMGLLQAPLGRPVSGRTQLAFGHRRVAALRLLHERGLADDYVDMDVALITDEDMAVMGLTENERRKDLSQLETLRAYRKAIDETELTATVLAKQLGIADSMLSNNLRVLELPDFILEHVESGNLGITVAREFLPLQNAHHAHHENMREIVRHIVDLDTQRGKLPANWTRRNVRKRISENIAYAEKEFRPLGPPTGHTAGGGGREATFDINAFDSEFGDCTHTVPADDGRSENYRALENYDKSRTWTCEVREWSRWQSRATREANAQAVATGAGEAAAGEPSGPAPTGGAVKMFAALLANDPVWKAIPEGREQPGHNARLTDYEREQLGTRAELVQVSRGQTFWRRLERGTIDEPYRWRNGEPGSHLAPWFPIRDCRDCVAGAAYAHSGRDRYPLDRVTLVCINRECHDEKAAAGERDYREKTEARRRGLERQDRAASERLAEALQEVPDAACQALATAVIAAEPRLEWEHPIGGYYDQNWSYRPGTVARIEEVLGPERSGADPRGHFRGTTVIREVNGADLDPEQARELAALLVTYNLRRAGQLDMLDFPREKSPADTRRCTRCGEDKPLDAFGQQKRQSRDGVRMVPKTKCKECLVDAELERRAVRTPAEVPA